MTATREIIGSWLASAIECAATHLIVVCDSFSYEDYPVYCFSASECRKQYARYNGRDLQWVMEVYDLSMDIDLQLRERRALHLPPEENAS